MAKHNSISSGLNLLGPRFPHHAGEATSAYPSLPQEQTQKPCESEAGSLAGWGISLGRALPEGRARRAEEAHQGQRSQHQEEEAED